MILMCLSVCIYFFIMHVISSPINSQVMACERMFSCWCIDCFHIFNYSMNAMELDRFGKKNSGQKQSTALVIWFGFVDRQWWETRADTLSLSLACCHYIKHYYWKGKKMVAHQPGNQLQLELQIVFGVRRHVCLCVFARTIQMWDVY